MTIIYIKKYLMGSLSLSVSLRRENVNFGIPPTKSQKALNGPELRRQQQSDYSQYIIDLSIIPVGVIIGLHPRFLDHILFQLNN